MRILATSSCCAPTPGEVCHGSHTPQQAHSSRPSRPSASPPPPLDDLQCTEQPPWRKGLCPPPPQKNHPSLVWGSNPGSEMTGEERGPTHRPGERNKHLSEWEKTLQSPGTSRPVGPLAPSTNRLTKKEDSAEEGLPERKA